MPTIKPRTPAPSLAVDTLAHGAWKLHEQRPDTLTLAVFYRGYHCPVCKVYIGELAGKLSEFTERGVDVIAVSGDSEERARKSAQEWNLGSLTIGYGQSIDSMREWGLFVSQGIKDGEPDQFGEPGLFWIKPGGDVFYEVINSMPFGRPHLDDVLDGLDFVKENDYPARGEA